jgi:hypothetical protein
MYVVQYTKMWYNITNVDLMFLLTALQMNTLIHLPIRGDIKQALGNLAKKIDGLDETFKQEWRESKITGNALENSQNRF